jgi:transcriptional regulator
MAQMMDKKTKKGSGGWTSYMLLPGVILAVALAVLVGLFIYVYSKRNVARMVDNIPITERQISIEIFNLQKENPSFRAPTNASQAEIDESYKQARTAAMTRRTNVALIEIEAREKIDKDGKSLRMDDVSFSEIENRMKEICEYVNQKEEEYLVEQKITRDDFISQVREAIIYERVTKEIYTSIPEPSKPELEKYFDTIKSNYEVPETADFYMCTVKNMDDAKKVLDSIDNSQKNGLKLVDAMKKAAKEFSTDAESKKVDGEMKDIPREYFTETPEVANAIFPTANIPKEAQLTMGIVQPIITQKKGVYIILLMQKNPPQKPTLYGKWKLFNTETRKVDEIPILDLVKDNWFREQGQAKVTRHLNDLSNKYENLIYDRVKGNLPWSGLEKFFEGLLGTSAFSRLMGWD